MKIYLEKRQLKTDKTRDIRLVFDERTLENQSRKKRFERLGLFVYDAPINESQRKHNKEHLQLAEAIKSKRLLEAHNEQYGFTIPALPKMNFLEYFAKQLDKRAKTTSSSNHAIWVSAQKHLIKHCNGVDLQLSDVNRTWLETFKYYLERLARTKSDTPLSRNTQSTYFNKIRATLNEAHREGYIRDNPLVGVNSIKAKNTRRVYLTLDEVNALANAECRYPVLKRAFLFSCSTGLRWSDVQKLVWSEIETFQQHKRIIFNQRKLSSGDAKSLQYLDLPKSAESLIGTPKASTELVFKGLKYSSYMNVELLRWCLSAGISKHVTFHSGRHTFAVIQLSRGIDIYSVSRLLGHSELKTTEIYADIVESKRIEAMLTFPDIFAPQ